MNDKNPEFQAALGEVLRDRQDGEHVTPDRLAAYHHDLLTPEEADAVQEHVAACHRCGDQLLELLAFEEEDEAGEDSGVADFETEADWRALRGRLVEDEQAPPTTKRVVPSPRTASRPHMAWGLAASLLVSVGLGAWAIQLRSKLTAARMAKFNVSPVSLEPDGLTRGGPEESTVQCADGWAYLLLNPRPVFVPNVEHKLEILNDDDEVLWSRDGLLPIDSDYFSVLLPCPPPGNYRARLQEGESAPEIFELQVVR